MKINWESIEEKVTGDGLLTHQCTLEMCLSHKEMYLEQRKYSRFVKLDKRFTRISHSLSATVFADIYESQVLDHSLADPGVCARNAPPRPKMSSFSCSFWENCPNNRLAPPLGLAHPRLGNPGSATAICLFNIDYKNCFCLSQCRKISIPKFSIKIFSKWQWYQLSIKFIV